MKKIQNETDKINWTTENYPNLCSPVSPCITLQWTFRDNKLINLPWALLVKDDIILVKPGQICPGYCESIDKNSEIPLLHAKEVYSPSLQNANEIFSAPKNRKSLENKKYRLLETPYLNNLRVYLEQSLDRPVTLPNQQRHLIMIKIIERFLLPFTFIASFMISLFRFFFPIGKNLAPVTFLLVPTNTILPLLPLVFPLAWNLINYLALARLWTIFDAYKEVDSLKHNPLEEDTENTISTQPEIKCHRRALLKNFVSVVRGDPHIMVHSANILHVFGTVTVRKFVT